jgi:hypothetical protein
VGATLGQFRNHLAQNVQEAQVVVHEGHQPDLLRDPSVICAFQTSKYR